MRLFLSSVAISDSQSVELAKLVGKAPKDIRLALIENAADTHTDDDPTKASELILEGLHYTDVVVVPHMDNPKVAAIIHGINDELKTDGYKTVPLADAQAFVVDGDAQKVI